MENNTIDTNYNPAYGQVFPHRSELSINTSEPSETLEQKVQRIMNNNEPITDSAPIIYTNRKDGVDPMHNIRTDRFELAIEDTDTISKMALAKREEFHKNLEDQNKQKPDGDTNK